MKLSTIIASPVFLFAMLMPGLSMANECTRIDCDCAALPDAKWRTECQSRENEVRKECVENGGRPASYCSLHGPRAYPVAISLKPDDRTSTIDLSGVDSESLKKQIHTQQWSLQDSLAALKSKEAVGNYGEAIQLSNLFERDSDRLYQLMKKQLVTFVGQNRTAVAQRDAETYGKTVTGIALTIADYSRSLWDAATVNQDSRTQKALRAMSLKLARLSASIFEQGADLYGQVGMNKESAEAWQKSAAVARELISRESATENKKQHVQFYQAQAASRLHRATYYWLLTDEYQDRAVQNIRVAEDIASGKESDEAVAEFDNLHEADEQPMRAMKRPSR